MYSLISALWKDAGLFAAGSGVWVELFQHEQRIIKSFPWFGVFPVCVVCGFVCVCVMGLNQVLNNERGRIWGKRDEPLDLWEISFSHE